MKDEIPQAVIDSHVKNAANARAEKAKQERAEENTGRLETQMCGMKWCELREYRWNECVTAVLSQLSYEDPYTGGWPIYWVHQPVKGMKHWMKWCELRTIAVNRNLSNCENSPKKKKFFGASTGFEPVASALALQCSPSWAMKTHILEAGQFIEFINPWKEWNTEWNDVNCGNTNEMSMWPSQWIAI